MKAQPHLRLILLLGSWTTLVGGCMFATEAPSWTYIHGELIDNTSKELVDEISIGLCYRDRDNLSTVDIGLSGEFGMLTSFWYGGILVLVPPLGEFPRSTPQPPSICVSFPEKPGEYYEITAERKGVSWRILRQDDGQPLERNTLIPTLVEAELVETELVETELLEAELTEFRAKYKPDWASAEYTPDWIVRLRFRDLN